MNLAEIEADREKFDVYHQYVCPLTLRQVDWLISEVTRLQERVVKDLESEVTRLRKQLVSCKNVEVK